jgi:hypothetical protein
MKPTAEAAVGVAAAAGPVRHDQASASPLGVCRWPTMTIRDLTMDDADAAHAADPLIHLGPRGHVGRIEVRYWYFRPELKYLTCHACADGGDPSLIELEAVACQHRIPAG